MRGLLGSLDSGEESGGLHPDHLQETVYSVLFQMNANDPQHRSGAYIRSLVSLAINQKQILVVEGHILSCQRASCHFRTVLALLV